MKEVLRSFKRYSIIDYLIIPFRVCPIYTLIIGINHILSALEPVATVLATAKFVDTAVDIFNGKQSYSRIYLPLIYLMLIISYEQLNRTLIFNFINVRFEMAILKYFKSITVAKRSKLEYKHIENNEAWDLITRTCNDPVGKIEGGMYNLFELIEVIIIIGSISLVIFSQIWWAALILMGITGPLLFLALKFGKEVYEAKTESEKLRRRNSYYAKILKDRDSVEERVLFNYSGTIIKKWIEKYEEARVISLKAEAKNFIRLKGASLITIAVSLSIIVLLLFLASKTVISIGVFVSLSTAAYNLVQTLSWRLAYAVKDLAGNREYIKDLTKFMGLSEREGALDLPAVSKDQYFESLEFKDVSFKYPEGEKYVLRNFNLKLVKNRHYAFVGINGAGKTTLTKLLTGMYDDYTGEIFINDKNLKDYGLAELKAIFAVVYQDFAKYFISVKDNVSIGDVTRMNNKINENHSNRDIEDAIDTIGISEVVKKLPQGIDTYLGKIKENGVDLSFGEWQRLAIARALHSPAFVRILDEPTAAMDPVAESNLYGLFGEISKGKTTVFITHRLGAARIADEIIVMDQGGVAEKGSHKQLLELGGIYAAMFESQRNWYKS